jgi:hypothetical protein
VRISVDSFAINGDLWLRLRLQFPCQNEIAIGWNWITKIYLSVIAIPPNVNLMILALKPHEWGARRKVDADVDGVVEPWAVLIIQSDR